MAITHMFRALFLIIFSLISLTTCLQVKKYPLLMPNVHPDRDELYLCTPVRILPNKSYYIVGFEPNATMDYVHHMLVYGCSKPGNDRHWDCGEMAMSEGEDDLVKASPCEDDSHVLYAWARNAKTLELPQDVGFQIGEGTSIKYIVLQIHYSKKFPGQKRDNSGLFLMYTEQPQKKLAGIVLLGVGGVIPQRSITHMETACQITEDKRIFPFAYRTHTHSLGRVVSGYSIRRDENRVDHWTLLGKRDPLTPQMFYPVFDKTPINYGDRLAARCTMNSMSRNRDTRVGPTNNDSMCNFYLMYYVENGAPLDLKYCITEGPPFYYWRNEVNDLNHIPDFEASSLD